MIGQPLWTEGTLLTQQHLQQWDIYMQSQLTALQRLAPHQWGWTHFDIDTLALSQEQCVLSHGAGVLNNGLPFEIKQPLSLDLSQDLPEQVTIFLVRPDNQCVEGITGYNPPLENPAYTTHYLKVADLYDAQRQAEVAQKQPKWQLHAERIPPGYIGLPLAKLMRVDLQWCVCETFWPPSCSIQALPTLVSQIQRITQRIQTTVGHLPIYFDVLLSLHAAVSQPMHPEAVLRTLLHSLSLLSHKLCYIPYLHHESGQRIYQILCAIDQQLDTSAAQKPQTLSLVKNIEGYWVGQDIPATWFQKTLCLALPHAVKSVSAAVIGAPTQLMQLRTAAVPGLLLKATLIKNNTQMQNFEIQKTEPYWSDVKNTGAIAVWLPEQNNVTELQLSCIGVDDESIPQA